MTDPMLLEDEADAMDLLIEAHEIRTYVTAATSGIEQSTLLSLHAKGVVKSVDGLRFALTSEDLEDL